MNYEAPICEVVRINDLDIIRTSTGDTPWVDLEQDQNIG